MTSHSVSSMHLPPLTGGGYPRRPRIQASDKGVLINGMLDDPNDPNTWLKVLIDRTNEMAGRAYLEPEATLEETLVVRSIRRLIESQAGVETLRDDLADRLDFNLELINDLMRAGLDALIESSEDIKKPDASSPA